MENEPDISLGTIQIKGTPKFIAESVLNSEESLYKKWDDTLVERKLIKKLFIQSNFLE
jgi:hypothetical protein